MGLPPLILSSDLARLGQDTRGLARQAKSGQPRRIRQGVYEALTAEKRREDRIRATGRRVIRWTWSELANPGSFSAFLAAAGVPRQPLPACRC